MILVTGGLGYIGSHTAVELIESGKEIVIIDDLSNSKIEVLDSIEKITGKRPEFYELNLLDAPALDKVFENHKIDSVMHFAGLKAVGESVKIPLRYYECNVYGTITLLKAMEKHCCNNLVFSSSATVYGAFNTPPYVETADTAATSPYGYTKVFIERIIIDYAKSKPEFSACMLRYFNPIGAHRSGLIGENPNDIPNNLMPYIAKVSTKELPELFVFGNDYETPDGTCVRDYVHVQDLAAGHVIALDYTMRRKGTDAINLGTGKGTSVLELVKAYERASGIKIPYKFAPRRAGDLAICYASTDKAEAVLRWKAARSIEECCADTWNYVKNFCQ